MYVFLWKLLLFSMGMGFEDSFCRIHCICVLFYSAHLTCIQTTQLRRSVGASDWLVSAQWEPLEALLLQFDSMLPSATSDKAPASPASSALLLLPRSSHWLHRCSHTLGWLLSRSAGDQSIGVPPVELEGQLSVWLRSLLFEGGLPFIQGAKSASGEDSSESLPWEAEEAVLEEAVVVLVAAVVAVAVPVTTRPVRGRWAPQNRRRGYGRGRSLCHFSRRPRVSAGCGGELDRHPGASKVHRTLHMS